jgi:hypothetical protein
MMKINCKKMNKQFRKMKLSELVLSHNELGYVHACEECPDILSDDAPVNSTCFLAQKIRQNSKQSSFER